MKLTASQRGEIIKAIGGLGQWAKRCHECSLAIVRSGLLPEGARVARGFARGVPGQHSWVVVGDPYDATAPVIDGTLWSYVDHSPRISFFPNGMPSYRPHGAGSIWEYGRPADPRGEIIALDTELSPQAQRFMLAAAPRGLDYTGWATLAHAPVGGWPAGEILGAMYDDDRLRVLIPIDVVGMATDRNPDGLYW